jgi:adenosine deaminase CECR1
MLKGLSNYESAFRKYTRAVIQSFVDDNILYAEIRPNFPANTFYTDDGELLSNVRMMEVIMEETQIAIATLPQGKAFLGMKVIYCCPRSFPDIKAYLDECIELKRMFGDTICGKNILHLMD